ncbi:histone-lysine N-methyltransferase [Cordyceps fumosorosea ARSEF 2679]|uniref:Histone-lysine N-methyltransferase n=1 Tax=Cordyceps fumosorosea (strain ARSEF 2679) TaxID=1081104 RepID=A0A167LG33_CORFA|nr:histone-lysine N-methyltransferase [Cordyceps fumosorosea ARSEF 2679]OAA53047.1 histone-lysine N-methyltransferase [Cordyceps fumosorosea ARSEF 2679]
MEQAIREHFYHHGKTAASQSENCHWCQLRSLPTQDTIPISIVNDVDGTVLPKDFRFINDMVFGQGVEPAEDSFRSGCSCTDDSNCQYTDCLCLADLEEDEETENDKGMNMNDGIKKAYPYHTHGVKAGLLRSRLQNSSVPLYECHKGCACSSRCPNRVVERGRTVPLQIFKTDNRGWGVRSAALIKRGQFVDRYLGEIITAEEADRRRANSAVSQQKDVYLFALDKFTDPDSLDPRLNGPPLEVDGEFMSGPTRFINHSCDPNLRIFARVGDHADKHIHDLALFAIKDIQRGEELTFDYVDGVVDEQDDQDGNVDGMTKCLCGRRRGGLLPENKRRKGVMRRLRLPRQKAKADAQTGQLRAWLRDKSRLATILEDHDFTINTIFVPNVYKEYTAVAAESIMTCCTGSLSEVRIGVDSFFESPVVKAAYRDFKVQCDSMECSGFGFLESELINVLASLAENFHQPHLGTTNPPVPWRVAKMAIPNDGKLKQLTMEYLVRIEIWRREGLARGRPWQFGTHHSRYQFLASTLVQLWYMDNEGCFSFREVQTSSRDWNLCWDSWFEKCIQLDAAASAAKAETARAGSLQFPSTDGEGGEEMCFGVGQRLDGWLERA